MRPWFSQNFFATSHFQLCQLVLQLARTWKLEESVRQRNHIRAHNQRTSPFILPHCNHLLKEPPRERNTSPTQSGAWSPADEPQDWLRNKHSTAMAFCAKQSNPRQGEGSAFGERQLCKKICHLVKLSFPHPHGFRHYVPHWAVLKHIHNTVRHTWYWSLLAGYIRVIIFSPCFLYYSLSICYLPLLETGYQAVGNCYVKETNGLFKKKLWKN